ncbi:MAG: hypothetical protein ACPG5P_06910, partial [Saprospiraceae bacterium]
VRAKRNNPTPQVKHNNTINAERGTDSGFTSEKIKPIVMDVKNTIQNVGTANFQKSVLEAVTFTIMN